jgi:hypothetical protein
MSQITDPLNAAVTPGYSIDQILQSTQQQSQPSGFRRVLGGLLGGIGNVFAPGIGGLLGSAVGGTGLMGSNPAQYLQLQQQMNMQQEAWETASAVMKCRHDASMSAIRNIS